MVINNGPHDKAQIDVSAATRSQERAICSRRLPCSKKPRLLDVLTGAGSVAANVSRKRWNASRCG
ncbi:hypothetical protein ALQ53_200229 [Pseudomonas cannabina]|uniref:Uncharacterized protein n=1 Tax=Pseudomonas cannabina TaxID=86840 RepID=A0AB37QAS8_PSECA|nr:hypothetical protein ALQ53_200229 [Pseudomonas cannabina]